LASSSSITPALLNAPFSSHILVFSGARPFCSFDDLASNLDEPLHALNAYQEAQNSAAHQFDLSIGLKSPSPDLPLEEELRCQEEKDIERAAALPVPLSGKVDPPRCNAFPTTGNSLAAQ
jgi:hypothetical protein